ncbi:MAG: RNA pseudouridine synthase [Candidatus Hydrogenedentes bacterium]|nr:RNA pseudouridine synthase [Candidatus Hydrogenedentota bacterium]
MSIPFNCSKRHQPPGIKLLYEDRDIIVVDKVPGLLTIATDKKQTQTAYYRLMAYVRKGNAKSKNRIFIVHRLDRDVSGVLIFAKTSEAKKYLQEHWGETEKKYITVVHGKPEKSEATISSYLTENRARIMYSTHDPQKGKLSHTAYRVLKGNEEFSLLEINLLTGRKNQIRAHLAESGHPIVGDKKYGKKRSGHKRLALHAYFLSLTHPYNKKPLVFETEVPGYFNALLSGNNASREKTHQ